MTSEDISRRLTKIAIQSDMATRVQWASELETLIETAIRAEQVRAEEAEDRYTNCFVVRNGLIQKVMKLNDYIKIVEAERDRLRARIEVMNFLDGRN